jgi:hypothetical protein
VNDIGAKTGVDSDQIGTKSFTVTWSVDSLVPLSAHTARILRYLASRHVFTEVTPDVYANNRISSILAKAKPLEELKKEYVNYNHVTTL